MNIDPIHDKWTEIRERIRTKWAKLSPRDIDRTRGNLDGLIGHIQKSYGCAKNQAEREYHEFRVSLRPLMQPAIQKPVSRFL